MNLDLFGCVFVYFKRMAVETSIFLYWQGCLWSSLQLCKFFHFKHCLIKLSLVTRKSKYLQQDRYLRLEWNIKMSEYFWCVKNPSHLISSSLCYSVHWHSGCEPQYSVCARRGQRLFAVCGWGLWAEHLDRRMGYYRKGYFHSPQAIVTTSSVQLRHFSQQNTPAGQHSKPQPIRFRGV